MSTTVKGKSSHVFGRTRRPSRWAAYRLCASLYVATAMAYAGTPAAVFDQKSGSKSSDVLADPGDTITVTINNTCADLYDYQRISLATANPPEKPTGNTDNVQGAPPVGCPAKESDSELRAYLLENGDYCPLGKQTVYFTHDKQYLAYLIDIRLKDVLSKGRQHLAAGARKGLSADDFGTVLATFSKEYSREFDANSKLPLEKQHLCEKIKQVSFDASVASTAEKMTATTIDVVTEEVRIATPGSWVELAGGLGVSNLTDRKYQLIPNPQGGTGLAANIIAENTSARDSQRLAFVGFIHVHAPHCSSLNKNSSWLCEHVSGSLGLGINSGGSGSSINAFIGPSLRFGGQWFVTAGYNWGAVATLPAGERVGQPPTSTNALNNPGSRTAGALFFALSYSFLKPADSFFTKPFASTPEVKAAPKDASTDK